MHPSSPLPLMASILLAVPLAATAIEVNQTIPLSCIGPAIFHDQPNLQVKGDIVQTETGYHVAATVDLIGHASDMLKTFGDQDYGLSTQSVLSVRTTSSAESTLQALPRQISLEPLKDSLKKVYYTDPWIAYGSVAGAATYLEWTGTTLTVQRDSNSSPAPAPTIYDCKMPTGTDPLLIHAGPSLFGPDPTVTELECYAGDNLLNATLSVTAGEVSLDPARTGIEASIEIAEAFYEPMSVKSASLIIALRDDSSSVSESDKVILSVQNPPESPRSEIQLTLPLAPLNYSAAGSSDDFTTIRLEQLALDIEINAAGTDSPVVGWTQHCESSPHNATVVSADQFNPQHRGWIDLYTFADMLPVIKQEADFNMVGTARYESEPDTLSLLPEPTRIALGELIPGLPLQAVATFPGGFELSAFDFSADADEAINGKFIIQMTKFDANLFGLHIPLYRSSSCHIPVNFSARPITSYSTWDEIQLITEWLTPNNCGVMQSVLEKLLTGKKTERLLDIQKLPPVIHPKGSARLA